MILFSDKNCKDEELIVKIKQEKVSKRTKTFLIIQIFKSFIDLINRKLYIRYCPKDLNLCHKL